MTIHAVPVSRPNRPGLPRPVDARPSLPTPSPRQQESHGETSRAWEEVSPEDVMANPFAAPTRSPRAVEVEEELPSPEEEVSPEEVMPNPFVPSPQVTPVAPLPIPKPRAALPLPTVSTSAHADVETPSVETAGPLSPPARPRISKKVRRRRDAREGGIVLKAEDERWLRFIAESRYATVRHIHALEGEDHREYYAGVNLRTKEKAELRALKRDRNRVARGPERAGKAAAVRAAQERVDQYEEYIRELDAYLKTIAPSTTVRDRLDKLAKAGYLSKASYTGLNTVYWVTQRTVDVFSLDVPALGTPSEGQLGHTLAIAYLSAMVRSGLKTFGSSGRSPAVVLTETQIRRQAVRAGMDDPDRRQFVQWNAASADGYGVADQQTALEIADHYVAASRKQAFEGTHLPDLVLLFETEEGSAPNEGVIAIEVERTRKSKTELRKVLHKYRDSADRFKRVFHIIPCAAEALEDPTNCSCRSTVKTMVTDGIHELGLSGMVSVVEYDPREWNATMVTW